MAQQTKSFLLNGIACTAKRELVSCGGDNRYIRAWVARRQDGSAVLASDVAVNGKPVFDTFKQLAAAVTEAERAHRNRDRSGETSFEA